MDLCDLIWTLHSTRSDNKSISPEVALFSAAGLGYVSCADCMCVCSVVSDSATPWTVACQAPLSMEFSRQESWNGLPFPSPEDLPNPGIKPTSLASPVLAGGFFTTSNTWETRGSPTSTDLSSVSLSTIWTSVYFLFPHRNDYRGILWILEEMIIAVYFEFSKFYRSDKSVSQ